MGLVVLLASTTVMAVGFLLLAWARACQEQDTRWASAYREEYLRVALAAVRPEWPSQRRRDLVWRIMAAAPERRMESRAA